jgi:outer membrane cobalamin receptor
MATRRPAACAVGVALVLAWLDAAATQPKPATIADLLDALRATGVDLLYSSELVPADLLAPAESRATDPLARVVEALSAHGLALRSTGYRHWVVTRAAVPTAPAPGPADNSVPPRAEVESLDEVPVYSSRRAFGATSANARVSFTGADLEQVPGSQNDAVRALHEAPGLATNLSAQPYVRGASLDDVLVQFDGIPLANPFHLKNFQTLVSAFDPSAIDHVDVYTGGFPVRYGTRSGGVIDLVPRSVRDSYEHAIGASLVAYDFATVGRGEQLPVEWLATVRQSVHDVLLKPLDANLGEPVFADGLGRFRWRSGPTSTWTLGWLVLDDRLHLTSDAKQEVADAHYRDRHAWLAYDRDVNDALHSRTSVAVFEASGSRAGTLALTGVGTAWLNESRASSSLELRSLWSYAPSANLAWTFGVELADASAELHYARQSQYSATIAAFFGRPVASSLNASEAPHELSYATFASVRREWGRFEAEFGARVDGQRYDGFAARAQASPRLNFRYDLAAPAHLFGSWGHFTQAQRVDEWRSEEAQAFADPATRAVDAIVGLAFDGPATLRWRLEGYREQWSHVAPYYENSLDPVSLIPDLEPDRLRLAPNAATSRGIELTARGSLGPAFDWWGTYTRSRTTDELAGANAPRSWDQPHAASLGLAWTGARTSASTLVAWHSGWPRTPYWQGSGAAGNSNAVGLGPWNSARWGDFLSVDLRIARKLTLARSELSVWFEATNAGDRRNACCVDFSAPVRAHAMPLGGTESWLPRLLNVGFSWRTRPTR